MREAYSSSFSLRVLAHFRNTKGETCYNRVVKNFVNVYNGKSAYNHVVILGTEVIELNSRLNGFRRTIIYSMSVNQILRYFELCMTHLEL